MHSWMYAIACHLNACGIQDCLTSTQLCPPYSNPTGLIPIVEDTDNPLGGGLHFPEGPWRFLTHAIYGNFHSEVRSCRRSLSKKAGKDLGTDEHFHTCFNSFHLIPFSSVLWRK